MNDIITPKCPQYGAEMAGGVTGRICPRCAAAFLKAAPTEAPGNASKSFTPPSVAELSPLFPQLEILELIGQGGMGAVFKARQKELDRIVALKILPPGIGDAAFADRFAREAKALARLNHPGIVTLYEFGRSNGLFFFLMEFVDGVTLRHVLQTGRISAREALAIVPEICDALQYAHDEGIVHRDIKPENILLNRRGRTKVADFGLAKLMESGNAASDFGASASVVSATVSHAGQVLGTPYYMAPEQAEKPAAVDHRADIYALGVVFYQMLTGELPGKNIVAPSKKVQIDVRLDEVVLRALEKNPDQRYAQASALRTDVETIATTERRNGFAAPQSRPSGARPASANWLLRAAVVNFACAILVGAIVAVSAMAGGRPAFIGPTNPGAERGMDEWYNGVEGGGSVSIEADDPASGNNYFRIGVTNAAAYPINHADLRSVAFPLGGNTHGPFTFSFAYKLPGKVKPGEDIDVAFRFFGRNEDDFLGQKDLHFGSTTHDSEMTEYKTVTVSNILAPKGAFQADIWVVAGIAEPWTSGYGQFDNFSVTAVPTLPWARIFMVVGILAAVANLVVWALYLSRRQKKA